MATGTNNPDQNKPGNTNAQNNTPNQQTGNATSRNTSGTTPRPASNAGASREVTFTPAAESEGDISFTLDQNVSDKIDRAGQPAETPQAVSKAIDNGTDKAKDAVDRASEGLKQTAAQANVQIQQVAEELRDRAYTVKGNASQSLRQAAQNIREQVRSQDGQPVAQAESIATQMEKMATYLESNSFEEIEGDARRTIQKNPWQSVGVAAFVGFAIARLFGKR